MLEVRFHGRGGQDAAFVAVGAHLGRRAYIPACSAAGMLDAVSLLRDMETGTPPQLGRRVVVHGGGNTVMDAARTARRPGAEEAVVVGTAAGHIDTWLRGATLAPEPGGAYAYAIDLDDCKGCGICAHECPAGAIAMEPEEV